MGLIQTDVFPCPGSLFRFKINIVSNPFKSRDYITKDTCALLISVIESGNVTFFTFLYKKSLIDFMDTELFDYRAKRWYRKNQMWDVI